MSVNAAAVGTTSDDVPIAWDEDTCIRYALSIGAAADDPAGSDLAFTTENTAGIPLRVVPSMCVILARQTLAGHQPTHLALMDVIGSYDRRSAVHAEQSFVLHRPIPTSAEAVVRSRITGVYDKGSGALVVIDTEVRERGSGAPMFTTTMSSFLRGEGGFGGHRGPSVTAPEPAGHPDDVVTYDTRRDQALLYRLNGDRNPLHSDPVHAADAGFPTPILHGLCTFGFACRALLRSVCGGDPTRLHQMHARFTSPVLPGERIQVRIWSEAPEPCFRVFAGSRCVLDGGTFQTS